MKILCLGDTMIDCYWTCEVSRIAPEAPVPVMLVKSTETRPGAAANVANNIEAMGVPVERIFGRGERIMKIRALRGAQYIARADFDHPQEPIPADSTYQEALGRCEIVVFSDYGKGSLSGIQDLISLARSQGKPVLVDPKGFDYSKYRGATMLKPNREEMKGLVGGWKTQDELDFKARQFLTVCGVESILLTRATDGMTLYTRTETLHVAAQNKAPVDVSGAGETVLAAYAVCLAKGLSPPECLNLANKAAGLAVGRFGTAVINEQEVFG